MSKIAEIHENRHLALTPPVIGAIPDEMKRETRPYQGIPGIEAGPDGSLYATWYAGGKGEGPDNYVVLSVSRDNGHTWKEIQCISHEGLVRCYDPALWFDPQGRLWWFWTQTFSPVIWEIFDGKCGVWCACCEDPTVDTPVWSAPRRIAEGIMMNKPTVAQNGDWLLPTAIWACSPEYVTDEEKKYTYSNVTISRDNGATVEYLGSADVPQRSFDEHCIIERKDGSLWMLVRCYYGIGESFSTDGGKTWTPGAPSILAGPNSRFAIRRLQSGKLVLINHRVPHTLPGELTRREMRLRTDLTAWLSDDDGKTWYGGLLISNGNDVSYPDLTQDKEGRIRVIYDQQRYTDGSIFQTSITEDDIAAGHLVTPGSYTAALVSALIPKK